MSIQIYQQLMMTIIICQSWDDASGYGQWVYWASRQHTVNNKSGKNNERVGQKRSKQTNKQTKMFVTI